MTLEKGELPTPVFLGFPGGSDGEESACNVGDLGSIPGLGGSPGGEHGNPLQYSCLENPSHGQRGLVGYSPCSPKDSDKTERLSTAQHSTKSDIMRLEICWRSDPSPFWLQLVPSGFLFVCIYLPFFSLDPLKLYFRDFSGGLVAKTPVLPIQGGQVPSLVRELDLTCSCPTKTSWNQINKLIINK